MAQLSCMYCGRKLQIKGQCSYGKGRCPACHHIIFIRNNEHLHDVLDSEIDREALSWSKMSNEQIAKQLKVERNVEPQRESGWKLAFINFWSFLPSYDEITLFTLSFSLIFLFMISGDLREELSGAIIRLGKSKEPVSIILGLMAAAGMVLSLISIFRRSRYDYEKYLMLLFAVFVTAGTGIYSGWLVLKESEGWLIVFPIWNIINGLVLLILLRLGELDTDCIVENDFNHWQVFAGIGSTVVILGLCTYVFKMHWAISYSVCVCYTLTINDVIFNILGINRITQNTEDRTQETEL